MMKLEKKGKKFIKKTDDKYDKVYLIHHMHHFQLADKTIHHELHHCFLFVEKFMKGKRYLIIHKAYKNNVYHCLSEKFVGKLYDHQNNVFNVVMRKINNIKIYEIQF